jgi:hypothetical protein
VDLVSYKIITPVYHNVRKMQTGIPDFIAISRIICCRFNWTFALVYYGQNPGKGGTDMYQIEYERGHVAVYSPEGAFLFTADNYSEAMAELRELGEA